MGNTLIQDSATGNIMGLNPGFIPIGMKEHGGIMYIASVNKEGKGEIGTIPSPIIRDIYKDKVTFEVNQSIPINVGDALKISNKLYPADKFIANLQMSVDETGLVGQKFKKNSGLSPSSTDDPSDIILGRDVITYANGKPEKKTLYTPLLSYNSNISKIKLYDPNDPDDPDESISLFSSKGVYSLDLYSRHDSSSDILAGSLSSPQLYQDGDGFVESNYWYIHTDSPTDVFPKDLLTATLNQDLKQFPSNNKPGYLAVKLQAEGINKFDILPRAKDPFYTPITYKSYQSDKKPQYYTYFPGFYYSTNSGIYIDRIEARVIDESTANEMPLEYPYVQDIPKFTIDTLIGNSSIPLWKSIYLSSPKELSNLFKNADGNTAHIYNTSSNDLPQVQSVSDHHSFILTTLKGITDHSNTSMESSTEGENKTYGGVFCVPLGEKYNNWYRAEIDYYDQYNNKQGTFTKRFNPYLNDVFGTNLTVDGKELAEAHIMGKSISTKEQILQSEEDEYIITYKSKVKYTDKNYVGDDPNSDEVDIELSGSARNAFIQKTCLVFHSDDYPDNVQLIYSETSTRPTTLSFSAGKPKSELTSNIYSYLYTDIQQKLEYQFKKTEDPYFHIYSDTNALTKHRLWYSMYNLSSGHDVAWDNDWTVTGQHTFPSRSIYLKYGDTSKKLDYSINWSNKDQSYLRYPQFQFACQTDLMDPSFKEEIDISSLEEDGTFNFTTTRQKSLSFCFGQIENMNQGFDRDWAAMLYTINKNEDHNFLNLQFKTKGTKSLTLLPSTLTPSYSITPYFCLTGTTEDGSSTYVQRLKIDGQNLVFKHNFETDPDQVVHNYISTVDNSTPSTINQLSYTFKTPFSFYKNELAYKQRLEAGIYVLNIQRCPGQTERSPFTLNEKSNLYIKIGSYSKIIPDSEWRIQPIYSDPITNSDMMGDLNAQIYRPIVFIVPTSCEVEVSTDRGFYRQNVGLYKIKNVNKQDIGELKATLKDLSDGIIFYDEYMWTLKRTMEGSFINNIQKYNFIQKYGVFFKEAYVFIDGLISEEDNVITSLTIGDIICRSFPYIPSDPSVLPVGINHDYQQFMWNAYIMPESILHVTDADDYPTFKFSNPLKEGYSTEPADGNLRQKI